MILFNTNLNLLVGDIMSSSNPRLCIWSGKNKSVLRSFDTVRGKHFHPSWIIKQSFKPAHQSGRRRTVHQEHCSATKQRWNRWYLSSGHWNPARRCSGQFRRSNSENTAVCQVDREERNVKNTAPELNEEWATGTFAPDTWTQLGEAQDKFAD